MGDAIARWQIVMLVVINPLFWGNGLIGSVAAAGEAVPALAPAGVVQAGATGPGQAAPAISEAALGVYRASCVLCHDVDGRGEVGREGAPGIPDFTDSKWQSTRSDAQLSQSILEGKGKAMPRMKNKLGSVDVKLMVAMVRAFAGGKLVIEEEHEPASSGAKPAGISNPAGPSGRPAASPGVARREATGCAGREPALPKVMRDVPRTRRKRGDRPGDPGVNSGFYHWHVAAETNELSIACEHHGWQGDRNASLSRQDRSRTCTRHCDLHKDLRARCDPRGRCGAE